MFSVSGVLIEYAKVVSDKDVLGSTLQLQDVNEDYLQEKNTYAWYYALGKVLRPEYIAEIGVRFGYATVALTKGSVETGREVILDGWDNNSYVSGSCQIAMKNWTLPGVVEHVIREKNSQELTAADLLIKYDMFHIDGNHSYAGAMHDMELAWSSLRFFGYMLVDDYQYEGNEVGRAVRDFVIKKKVPYVVLPTFRGLAIIQR